jgi:uncharacterized protein
MDRMAFDCEIKLAGDGADTTVGTVEGYGSMFGLLDRGGDIMEPGAFKATLGDWRKRKQLPAMLWQHQHDNPVGVWNSIVEDEKGLKVSGQLVMDVPQATVARALIKAGAVKGLSIGYQTRDAQVDRTTGARLLKKVDLWEISLVTIPMLPEAQISGVKGAFDPNSLERALRDEGLSIREAKLAVSVVRKTVFRDGGQNTPRDGAADVLMSLRKASEALR